MASSRRIDRYSWTLGLLNGLVAVLLLNVALRSLGGGPGWLVPWGLGLPWGILASWRGSVYVRQLLLGQLAKLRALGEGFAFMAAAMFWDLAPGAWTAMAAGHDVAWVAIVVYSLAAGVVGAAIAAALLALDLVVVEAFSRVNRAGGAS